MVAKHIRRNEKDLKINPDLYMKILLKEPNPIMTMQNLLEKLCVQLELNNNAFAFIERNADGYPVAIYPIAPVSVNAVYSENRELFLKFTLKNGKETTISYRDVIHLRQDFNSNDIFGTSKVEALQQLMEIVNTTDQGIVKAIKNGAVVKWLLIFKQALRGEDVKKATKEFSDNYLNIDNDSGGAAAADSKYDAKQVDPKDYIPNPIHMEKVLQRIYNIFGTNEKIIQSKYNEDEWISYFESEIEPVAIQLSDEFSRKLFSIRERSFGNEITFEAANLQYASLQTKLSLVAMVDRRALSPNEWRATLNLAPVEGGDEYIMRLDTARVKDSSKGGEVDGN